MSLQAAGVPPAFNICGMPSAEKGARDGSAQADANNMPGLQGRRSWCRDQRADARFADRCRSDRCLGRSLGCVGYVPLLNPDRLGCQVFCEAPPGPCRPGKVVLETLGPPSQSSIRRRSTVALHAKEQQEPFVVCTGALTRSRQGSRRCSSLLPLAAVGGEGAVRMVETEVTVGS